VGEARQAYRTRLSQQCERRGIRLAADQLDGLVRYLELLLQWQRSLNLSGLRQADQLMDVLIAESLDFLQGDLLPRRARLLDLGTGAGVPGIPLAICEPRLHLTFLDRSQKKMTFVRRVVSHLQLRGCAFESVPAEMLARRLAPEDRFDAVVSRGVGRVAHLLALAAPLLRPGGVLVLRKPRHTPELQEAAAQLASATWCDMQTEWLPASPEWTLLCLTRGDGALAP
jgi:16S rRNA (guanine527-N7)-methyltransferase